MASAIEPAKLKALMRLKPTLEDTAAYFECSTRTIQRYITDEFKMDFREFRDTHMVHTRLSLIRKAIDMGEKGNVTMLIFALKNLCGWKDRFDSSDDADKSDRPAQVTLTNDQLMALVKAARGLKAV